MPLSLCRQMLCVRLYTAQLISLIEAAGFYPYIASPVSPKGRLLRYLKRVCEKAFFFLFLSLYLYIYIFLFIYIYIYIYVTMCATNVTM